MTRSHSAPETSARPATSRPSLDEALEAALARWHRSSSPVTILFSGGVDSGLIAWELRRRPSTDLLTIGVDGAADLAAARDAAVRIGLPWSATVVAPAELDEALRAGEPEFGSLPVAQRSLFLALSVAIGSAAAPDVLCGQGADELFLGYAHFQALSPEAAGLRAASDLERLQTVDWPLTARLAARQGRRVHAPYLDPTFVAAALALPLAERMPDGAAKEAWRAWARERGLPAEIAGRPKRALQYGTGIDRWLRRLTRP